VRGVRLSINGSPTDPVAGLEQIVGQALLPVGTKKMVHLYGVALRLETVRQQAERMTFDNHTFYINQAVYAWYLHVYSCPTCKRPCYEYDAIIKCDACLQWYHPACLGISDAQLNQLAEVEGDWCCASCEK